MAMAGLSSSELGEGIHEGLAGCLLLRGPRDSEFLYFVCESGRVAVERL